ncbi:hypothetical protein SAMN05444149_1192 [Pseudosulfitobacter pseudonitzschiae]|uniref:hypothetical protein n=1 Tax=Pseudosulfitobacter pseudonitzschiae TaxID=1402135 RepID=UPI000910EF61|nr:hypothetical protein [Pseudosulfitobacter pseudonitzschiae]QKS11339.1 hypothetical protein HT745_22340 [Pseudosulfitobacter pseudonitzschiae]SHG31247.1 hypothetical protein SAMN05444149_1192 [Pseudosulfitobacter pseudonitzschiae]
MAYDTDETSQRGTRETKRKRKPTWKSRLLKGAFWVAWGMGKLFDLIEWLSRLSGD